MTVLHRSDPYRAFVWTEGNHHGVFVQHERDRLHLMTCASEDGVRADLHALHSGPVALLAHDEVHDLYLELARFLGKSGT
jgi:hypothetical protein